MSSSGHFGCRWIDVKLFPWENLWCVFQDRMVAKGKDCLTLYLSQVHCFVLFGPVAWFLFQVHPYLLLFQNKIWTTLRSSLRSPVQVEGPQGFLPQPEKDMAASPSSKDLWWHWPHPDDPGQFPINLITAAKSQGTVSQVLEVRMWTSLGPFYLTYHTNLLLH